MTRGRIFNIERFAIHDGPGIRTVVFMKGCPLRCVWCSSPESQKNYPELGYDADRCTHCMKCVEACPPKAIRVSSRGEVLTDRRLCESCGRCVEVCPVGARKMIGREVTAEEVVREVEKDTVFYQNSEGGVTLSGGEPTVQPEFSTEILRMCQHRGIHTAMETCGYVDWPVLEEMLKYVDLIYVDIKHVSPSEHSRLTQKGNRKILSNIRKIAEKHPDTSLIIRIPVIPGYNDTGENMTRTAEFVRQLGRVERIELLPYHRLGVYMYRILAKTYRLTHVEAPEEDRLQYLAELVKDQGVQVQIGG